MRPGTDHQRRGRTEGPDQRLKIPPAGRSGLAHVSTAAATAGSEQEFFDRLEQAGILVRKRFSSRNPGEVTGYAVALPNRTTAGREPVWFGGGKLAADLTLAKLRARWHDPHVTPDGPFATEERTAIWDHATRTTADAASQIRDLTGTDPAAAADAAWATADTLHVAASALRSRVIHQAADAYDRAARAPYGRIPRRTLAGDSLRRTARLLSAAAFVTGDPALKAAAFITRLGALAEAAADLRQAQQHAAQAAAARTAAERLRAAASPPAGMSPFGRAPPPLPWDKQASPHPQGQPAPSRPPHQRTGRTGRVPARRAGPGRACHVDLGGDPAQSVKDQDRRRTTIDPASHYPEPLSNALSRGAQQSAQLASIVGDKALADLVLRRCSPSGCPRTSIT